MNDIHEFKFFFYLIYLSHSHMIVKAPFFFARHLTSIVLSLIQSYMARKYFFEFIWLKLCKDRLVLYVTSKKMLFIIV